LWDDPRVRLDYPFLYFFDNKFFLPLHLYGVKLGGAKGIESIEMIHLHYPVPSTDHATKYSFHSGKRLSVISYRNHTNMDLPTIRTFSTIHAQQYFASGNVKQIDS
ncbi:hypothetical protein WUBG_07423, partial [Wuchereria bancrofti]